MQSAVYPEQFGPELTAEGRSRRGYTLIELLVVITIISLLAVVGFVNFKNFAADQVAKKAVGQVQSLLRLAQSNATSSTLCDNPQSPNQGVVSWSLVFTTPTTINLQCDTATHPNYPVRSYTLENAQAEFDCLVNNPTFKYTVRSGALTISPTNSCLDNAAYLTITIRNLRNQATQSFKLSKGGAIDVQ